MRVCLLGNATSVHLRRLAAGLAARRINVTILSHKPGELAGVAVERYAVPSWSLRALQGWSGRARSYWRGVFRRFDVVNQHFLHDWGFDPELARGGCFVVRAYGSDVVAPRGESVAPPALVTRRVELLRAARLVATAGPRFAATVAQFAGLQVEDIALLPFGVDLDLFAPARFGGGGAPTDPCVGFFKGFRAVYGPADLVRAVPEVLAAVHGARFELIGDGPELAACKTLAVSLGAHHAIDWGPRRAHEEIPSCLARWQVSVMPSYSESFGVAALESAAMRVPVVASRVGGIPDTVLDGETGLLVPPGSPSALAEAITRLLHDGPLRHRMGEAGRAFVESRYAWDRTLDDWVAALERARDLACAMV